MDNSPFRFRGVIEGFYGVYYTWPERNDLIRFIGQHGYNLYIYAPKDDWHHRQRWWQPYPVEVEQAFSHAATSAEAAGVRFCYALHCSVPPGMSCDQAIAAICAKLETLYRCGIRSFSLLFDDLELSAEADLDDLPQQAARVHAEICNAVWSWLQRSDSTCTLSMCPTDYYGSLPGIYVHTLGALLDAALAIFYTGPAVCSPTITTADAFAFAHAARRAPLIWDNYPVNDLAMQSELHLGPIRQRDPDLYQAVSGIVVNPMLQAEASKIPLLTYAAYLRDPQRYEPDRAWEQALDLVVGAGSSLALRHLASYTEYSCLGLHLPEPVGQRVSAILASWHDDQPAASQAARQALSSYLDQLREDCYHLKYRLDNLRLRENLLPWIVTLEAQLALARHALRVLDCREQRRDEDRARRQLAQALVELQPQPKRVAADALAELVQFVQALAPSPAVVPQPAPASLSSAPLVTTSA